MKPLTESETDALLHGDLVWREDVRTAFMSEMTWLSEEDKQRAGIVIESVPPAASHEIHEYTPDPRIWMMPDRDGNLTTFLKQSLRIKELEKGLKALEENVK